MIDELRHQDYNEDDYMEDEIGEPDPSMFMESFTPPPPIDHEGHLPGDLPSYKLDDLQVNIESRGAFRKAKVTVEEPPELNIADAIDAYLQHKLRYTPEMDGTKIGIMPSMSGGVRIVVNGQAYEAVDEVAEPVVGFVVVLIGRCCRRGPAHWNHFLGLREAHAIIVVLVG